MLWTLGGFETTRSSRRSQLVSTSNRKPSSGVMKIDPKGGDYIAKKCDMLSNDQLKNCERQLSRHELSNAITITKGVKEVIHTSDQIDQVFHTLLQIQTGGVKMCSHIRS